jgi:hypothetical protein
MPGRGSRYAGAAPPRKRAALRLMRKPLRKQGFAPKLLTTDKLGSYGSAFRHLRLTCPHEQGLRANNRAENSHQPVRSTSDATSSPDRPCGSLEPKRQRNGEPPSQQREIRLSPLPSPLNAVTVTKPSALESAPGQLLANPKGEQRGFPRGHGRRFRRHSKRLDSQFVLGILRAAKARRLWNARKIFFPPCNVSMTGF